MRKVRPRTMRACGRKRCPGRGTKTHCKQHEETATCESDLSHIQYPIGIGCPKCKPLLRRKKCEK